ncbi:DUF3987 domain-containing protein [Bradyrhizobium sp. LCT2]|uniref:DUF3987 domain-containing protein n=1 Tax=Bradyrhizobium sp. LCT2 TaxID=2493093 RepID=UPI00137438F6|nr:DUF3987 domain-containing protein [Bradyrhizobium sp. LCT2]QHP69420.1 DUF3987 domain-containing protein [Bradyrhizobium sp. LCT2]
MQQPFYTDPHKKTSPPPPAPIVITPGTGRLRAEFGEWWPWLDVNPWSLEGHCFNITWFSGTAYITLGRDKKLTLPELCAKIQATVTPKEHSAYPPSLSLYDCQRLEISGINATYPPIGNTPFATLREIVRKANIRALIFEGPHYLQAPPMLHLVVPFSVPLLPEKLDDMAARLNGILLGRLIGGSFDEWHHYPFGRIGDQQISAEALGGDFIDRRADLDAEALEFNHAIEDAEIEPDDDVKNVWPEPIDLWSNFEPPELPKGLLPSLIETFAFTESENMGCDPAGLAMGALVSCAAAIPDYVQLQMKPGSDSWAESARLWATLVGNVSAKKTPVLNRVTWPIKQIDSKLYRQYAAELERYEEQEKAKEKDSQEKPERPRQQRLRLEDTTIEAAQEVFANSPNGLLVLQDELSGWYGMMDRYNGNGAKDRGFWLQAYNGGEYIVNRIKRGSLFIENLSACVLGGIQPDKIRETAADGVDDGLLQRSIPIIMRRATVDRDEVHDKANEEYGKLIGRLNDIALDKPDDYLQFDSGGQKIRREMADKHLSLINCDAVNKKFAAHIGKYDGIFGRLCVVFHCIENTRYRDFAVTVPRIVLEKTARRAADFLHDFLLPHAVCFYAGVLGLSNDHESLTNVAGFILAKKLDKIDSRTIQRGNRDMRNMKKRNIEDVLDQLYAFGWIVKSVNSNGNAFGMVNPRVHLRFAERAKAEAARAAGIREAIATALGKAKRQ